MQASAARMAWGEGATGPRPTISATPAKPQAHANAQRRQNVWPQQGAGNADQHEGGAPQGRQRNQLRKVFGFHGCAIVPLVLAGAGRAGVRALKKPNTVDWRGI